MAIPTELYGPFGALVILAIGIVVSWRAVLTRKVVAGWLYDQEHEARIKAEAQVLELIKAATALTKIAANGSSSESGAPHG